LRVRTRRQDTRELERDDEQRSPHTDDPDERARLVQRVRDRFTLEPAHAGA
jgi:hypothetical protein